MYNMVPNDCHPTWWSLCSGELNSGLCASCTWLFPFWFSPCVVKIFSNVAIIVLALCFLSIKYHRHKHQECLLAGIKKKSQAETTLFTIDSIGFLYRNLGRQSSSPSDFFFFFSNITSGKGWPGSSIPLTWYSLHRPFSYLQRCVLFTSCLQFSCHLAAHEKGTDSRTSLPKVRYIHFTL